MQQDSKQWNGNDFAALVRSSPKSNSQVWKTDDFSTGNTPSLLKIERSMACEFVQIRYGANGTLDVIAEMKRIVRQVTMFDSSFYEFIVRNVLLANNLTSNSNPVDIFKSVYDFTVNNINYISDEKGLEDIRDARKTWDIKFGDCDDIAVFIATLLSFLGYEPEFVIARTPRMQKMKDGHYLTVLPQDYNHIYVSVPLNNNRYFFDATLQYPQFNVEALTVWDRKAIRIWNDGENPYLEGFGANGQITGLIQTGVKQIPVVGGIASTAVGLFSKLFSKPATDFTGLAATINSQLDTNFQTYLQNPTPDTYAVMFHAGDDLLNNYIGLNNNRASDTQKQTNASALAALTDKLNTMKSQKPETIAAVLATTNATAASNPVTGVATSLGIDPNLLLYGGLAITGLVVFYFVTKD